MTRRWPRRGEPRCRHLKLPPGPEKSPAGAWRRRLRHGPVGRSPAPAKLPAERTAASAALGAGGRSLAGWAAAGGSRAKTLRGTSGLRRHRHRAAMCRPRSAAAALPAGCLRGGGEPLCLGRGMAQFADAGRSRPRVCASLALFGKSTARASREGLKLKVGGGTAGAWLRLSLGPRRGAVARAGLGGGELGAFPAGEVHRAGGSSARPGRSPTESNLSQFGAFRCRKKLEMLHLCHWDF